MTPYREILRLHSQGISQRSIAASCNCSRNTVARTIEKANEHNLTAPLPKEFTDERLGELFYPKKPPTPSNRRMPDYAYVHKELARNGAGAQPLVDRVLRGVQAVRRCAVHVHAVLLLLPRVYQEEQGHHAHRPQTGRDHGSRLGRRYGNGHRQHHWQRTACIYICRRAAVQPVRLC